MNNLRGLFLSASLTVMGLCVAGQALAADMMVVDAWSRAMPPTARVLPVYLTLHNHGDKPVSLIKISSEFGVVELHKTEVTNDTMKMLAVDAILVESKQQVKLAPMGLHAMITELTKSVPVEGDVLPITLSFDNGEQLSVNAKVRKPADQSGDKQPADEHKHHH